MGQQCWGQTVAGTEAVTDAKAVVTGVGDRRGHRAIPGMTDRMGMKHDGANGLAQLE
jgi:hypothetical protein